MLLFGLKLFPTTQFTPAKRKQVVGVLQAKRVHNSAMMFDGDVCNASHELGFGLMNEGDDGFVGV